MPPPAIVFLMRKEKVGVSRKNRSVKSLTNSAVRLRIARNQSQKAFWSKFGISQACASRIECTTNLPRPVIILLSLYLDEVISEFDLSRYECIP